MEALCFNLRIGECATACVLHNQPASYSQGQGEAICRAVAKASLNRANESLGVHAKRDDLGMARMKPGLHQVEVRTSVGCKQLG